MSREVDQDAEKQQKICRNKKEWGWSCIRKPFSCVEAHLGDKCLSGRCRERVQLKGPLTPSANRLTGRKSLNACERSQLAPGTTWFWHRHNNTPSFLFIPLTRLHLLSYTCSNYWSSPAPTLSDRGTYPLQTMLEVAFARGHQYFTLSPMRIHGPFRAHGGGAEWETEEGRVRDGDW